MDKITTTITTYRRPALLRRAIVSVLNQRYPNLKVRVFDDASGDETAAMVSELASQDRRVKYFCQPRNTGMMPNTAAAVNSADSEFFTILNDDDFLLPDFFPSAIEAFQRHPDAMMFAGRLIYYEEEKPARTLPKPSLPSGYYPAAAALAGSLGERRYHTFTSKMFRRLVVLTTGGFDENVVYAGDLDFELRVLALHASIFSDVPCAVYCMHAGSSSYTGYVRDHARGLKRILDKTAVPGVFPEAVRQQVFDLLRGYASGLLFSQAITAAVRGDLELARDVAIILGRDMGATARAAALRLAAADPPAGNLCRFGLKALRIAVRAREAVRRGADAASYQKLVAGVLKDFNPRRGAAAA